MAARPATAFRAERETADGVAASSNLDSFGWADGSMWVRFRNGAVYQSPRGTVPSWAYALLVRVNSKGKCFNKHLRRYFTATNRVF
jgi:hypothetical protein